MEMVGNKTQKNDDVKANEKRRRRRSDERNGGKKEKKKEEGRKEKKRDGMEEIRLTILQWLEGQFRRHLLSKGGREQVLHNPDPVPDYATFSEY